MEPGTMPLILDLKSYQEGKQKSSHSLHTLDLVLGSTQKSYHWCSGVAKVARAQYLIQESPAIADKPARRLRKVCTVYVRAVGL